MSVRLHTLIFLMAARRTCATRRVWIASGSAPGVPPTGTPPLRPALARQVWGCLVRGPRAAPVLLQRHVKDRGLPGCLPNCPPATAWERAVVAGVGLERVVIE